MDQNAPERMKLGNLEPGTVLFVPQFGYYQVNHHAGGSTYMRVLAPLKDPSGRSTRVFSQLCEDSDTPIVLVLKPDKK